MMAVTQVAQKMMNSKEEETIWGGEVRTNFMERGGSELDFEKKMNLTM